MLNKISFFSLLLAASGAALAHYRITSALLGFYLLLLGVAIAALAFLVALFTAGKAKQNNKGMPWLALLIGLPALGGAGVLVFQAVQHPINDLTTDTVNPPKFLHPVPRFKIKEGEEFAAGAQNMSREYDSDKTYVQLEKYAGLLPVKTTFPPTVEFTEIVAKAVQEANPSWKNVLVDKEKHHLEFEVGSEFFGFTDDVVIEIRDQAGVTASIELRSRSRYGRSDLGANYKRLSALLETVRKASYDYESKWKKQEEEQKKIAEAKEAKEATAKELAAKELAAKEAAAKEAAAKALQDAVAKAQRKALEKRSEQKK